jgi:hypothetical protein
MTLADTIAEKLTDMSFDGTEEKFIVDLGEHGTAYTDKGQEIFNSFYDQVEDLLLKTLQLEYDESTDEYKTKKSLVESPPF